MMTATALQPVFGAYNTVLKHAPILAHIRSETDYEAGLEFIETLMNIIGDHPDDPRWGLLEIATKTVDAYEAHHYPELDDIVKQHGVASILRVLMDQHHITLADFPEIGGPDVVADVLDGKQDLTIQQAKTLSARFQIDPTLFF